jgi:hypothetical protein
MVTCHGTACDGLNEIESQMIVDDNQRGGFGPAAPGDGNQNEETIIPPSNSIS